MKPFKFVAKFAAVGIAATTLSLSACAPVQQRPYDPVRDKLESKCNYEAAVAVANIQNVFESGWRRAEFFDMCMKANAG